MENREKIIKTKLIWLLLLFLSACSGGNTVIRSEPPTAFITINGASQGVTPLEIKLDCSQTREFEVVLSLPGYLSETKQIHCRKFRGPKKNIFFELKPGQETTQKNLLPSPLTKLETGTLEIKSIPKESEVFLDGSFIGVAPLIKQEIKSGDHLVEVRKRGFTTWRKKFQIDSGSKNSYLPILEEE